MSLSVKLNDGYRADWEANGDRLAIYGPMQAGYRLLTVWAELATYQPAWAARADTVTEWRAYRYDTANRAQLIETRDVEAFNAPDEIAAWMEALIPA